MFITEPSKPHVIVECKVGDKPEDVKKRFDSTFVDGSGQPRVIVEAKYDESLEELGPEYLARSTLKYCIHFSVDERFPQDGWLTGSVHDLSIDIQHARASVRETNFDTEFNNSIMGVAKLIEELPEATLSKISKFLQQPESLQTWGMASLTLSGAIAFHDEATTHHGIDTISELVTLGNLGYAGLLKAWDEILEKDYFPIFKIAREILASIPNTNAAPMLSVLYNLHSTLSSSGQSRPQEIYSQGFQNVIGDRKKLAAFYTKSSAATLLASLTLPRSDTFEWSNTDMVKNLHIADFACGTGALLLATYKLMASYYELASKQPMRDLHPHMMSECLIGADVLPLACHMTASGLAGMYPRKPFEETRIYHVNQGGEKNNVNIGSLDWISQQSTLDDSETRLTGTGERGETVTPPHHSMDIILMNPPYAGSKGPGGRKKSSSTHVGQMFEAFDATPEERKRMGEKATKLYKSTACNHKKSIATFFADLANVKIKDGGMLGLILPMTVGMGDVWKGFRRMIAESYGDVVVISAPQGGSFSADTGMGEIMISARRMAPTGRAKFVSLDRIPESDLEAAHIGKIVRQTEANKLEGGVRGGTSISVGETVIGHVLDCTLSADEWMASAGSDPLLLQTAWMLGRGTLCIGWFSSFDIPMTTIGTLGSIGPLDLDIKGDDTTAFRGPFNILPKSESCLYPVIWNNHNDIQQQMMIEPDNEAERRPDESNERVEKILKTASRVHINRGMDTSSQCLPVSYLENPTLGGRAWPSICMKKQYEKAFVLWHNTTLGILCHWAATGHQQRGRSVCTVTTIPYMPTLDLNKLSKSKLKKMDKIFDEFATKPLDRVMNLWKDETRIEIDSRILKILGIDANLDDLRKRLCREPTIYGRKKIDIQ